MVFLKKFLFGAYILVFWLSIYGCSVETDARQGGCFEDGDCKYGRVCRDRICLESGELEHYESAEDVAMQIFTSFQTEDFDAYVQVVPTPRDLTFGFDIGEVDYTDPRVNDYIDSRYSKLENRLDRNQPDFRLGTRRMARLRTRSFTTHSRRR